MFSEVRRASSKKYAIWGMRLVYHACYGAAQVSLSERRLTMKKYNAYRPEGLSAISAFLILAEAALLMGVLEMKRRSSKNG